MYTDGSGCFPVLALLIGFGIGALIGGGFEIAKQVNTYGWNLGDWNWNQIGLSALGGGVAGLISAIPAGWLGTFLLGGTASVAGGLISGSVSSWETALIAFGIGAIANVAGKALGEVVKKIRINKVMDKVGQQADDILSMGAKKKSLTIMKMSGITDKFMRNSFKGWGKDQIVSLLLKNNPQLINSVSNSFIYSIISSGASSVVSGWY